MYIIRPKTSISRFRASISSMRSIVYHQVAERYTLMRDDIQPKGLMISTTLRAAMIYQVCDLDKKSRILLIRLFWCGRRDLNPYSVNHTPLKRARLPVPPLPHIKHLCFVTRRRSPRFPLASLPRTFDIIHYRDRFVNTFFEIF